MKRLILFGTLTCFVACGRRDLPNDFPKDVPVASTAKVTSLIDLSTNSNDSQDCREARPWGCFNLNLESDDSVEKLKGFYRRELAANGWMIIFDQAYPSGYPGSNEGSARIAGTKDKRETAVTIADGGFKRTVVTFVGPKTIFPPDLHPTH